MTKQDKDDLQHYERSGYVPASEVEHYELLCMERDDEAR
jgi:hypothetical protein